MTSPVAERHIATLDGLRGIAIILVIWHNAGLVGGMVDALPVKLFVAAANAGWAGVQLFFVLSGFLITGILIDSKGQPKAWRNFLGRRSLRIFPLYYVTLLLCFVVLPLLRSLPAWLAQDRHYQVWYWTYLVNWSIAFGQSGTGLSHFWSLAVEEQFYLLWPIIVFGCTRKGVAWTCTGLIATALVARVVFRLALPEELGSAAIYYWTISRWDALAVGGLLAVGMRDTTLRATLPLRAERWGYAMGIILLGFTIATHGIGNEALWVELLGQTLVAAFFGCVLLMLLGTSSGTVPRAARWICGAGALRTIGKYSYAMYVFHMLLLQGGRQLLPSDLDAIGGVRLLALLSSTVATVFGASFAAALLSWHILEAPMLRLKRYFPGPSTMALTAEGGGSADSMPRPGTRPALL